jgi:hypothetical protein
MFPFHTASPSWGNQLVRLVALLLEVRVALTRFYRLHLHRSQVSEPLALLVVMQAELVGQPQ